jgi:hypothetical protein
MKSVLTLRLWKNLTDSIKRYELISGQKYNPKQGQEQISTIFFSNNEYSMILKALKQIWDSELSINDYNLKKGRKN